MTETWVKKIENWLREGKDDAPTILGVPWDTEVLKGEDPLTINAAHPKYFFNIKVFITKHFARVQIDPGIHTDALDVAERMKIYKALLYINDELNEMKASLQGKENKILISADLNLASLSKTEFEDALTALFMGSGRVIEELGLEDQITNAFLQRNAVLIIEKLQEGWTSEAVLDFLTSRVGMDPTIAEKLLENVMKLHEAQSEKNEAQKLPERPVPEHLYG